MVGVFAAVGAVQVVVPSWLRRTCQPAWCLSRWSRRQPGPRFSALVSPSGNALSVQVAGSGGSVAGWEQAGAVPGDHQLGEVGGWPVSGGAVIDDLPEDRVDHQPPPGPRFIRGQRAGCLGGDRAVAVQPAGFVLDPGEGLEADDHADGSIRAAASIFCRQAWAGSAASSALNHTMPSPASVTLGCNDDLGQ